MACLTILYGHLEGIAGRFAREPSGYLGIDAGIFRRHGLDVSWQYVQGTEERWRRLESGGAEVSLVVGRASLRHFLRARTTRILGCAMNRCPYYLVTEPSVRRAGELKGRAVVCREEPARAAPLEDAFLREAGLRVGDELEIRLVGSDQAAFEQLTEGRVAGALLPRPYAFFAEERGCRRVEEWPEVVDDPLPITLETTAFLWQARAADLNRFLGAHRQTVAYMQSHRERTVSLLRERFEHSPSVAAKTFTDYVSCFDADLKVDAEQLEKLVLQVAPDHPGGAAQIAAEWLTPGALGARRLQASPVAG